MYPPILALHSLLRWIVLLCAVIACYRAVAGTLGRRPWAAADERAGRWTGFDKSECGIHTFLGNNI